MNHYEVKIYTDGSVYPNPGPCAAGVILLYGVHLHRYAEYLGQGTNNVAELTAILRGLQLVVNKSLPVSLWSDSQYAVNSANGVFNGVNNQDLIRQVRMEMSKFSDLNICWMRGHQGHEWNEEADRLAGLARVGAENFCVWSV